MRYKCLILDHDDTAVDSTASIHYPAHLEIMRELRPGHQPVSLDDWFLKNYSPGVFEYYTRELGFSSDELKVEYSLWRKYTQTIIPDFYDGFIDLLDRYRRLGGKITVVSHSECDIIEHHYHHHANDRDIKPEIIFGWDTDKTKRKPHPYPVNTILSQLGIKPEEALIVDDLKPGAQMGKATGVDVAAAGWGHRIPQIQQDMADSCDFYFSSVAEFAEFLFN